MRNSSLVTGQKHGSLTLVERLSSKDKHGARQWLCRCICGNTKILPSSKVRRGDSCGCVALEHHRNRGFSKGKRFGKLVVIERLNETDKFRSRKYLCECDCGNKKVMSSHNLTVGGTKSCGCLGHTKLEYGEAAFNQLYATYLISAKRRKLVFELTKEQFREFAKSKCCYCGTAPYQAYYRSNGNGEYVYNGVDRMNPDVGYIKDNCVACCGICNKMKMNLSVREFVSQVFKIHERYSEMDLGDFKQGLTCQFLQDTHRN